MRISNQILNRSALEGVQHNLSLMEEAQRRVSSGVRVQTPSDDPAAATDIMGTDRRLRALEQYNRGIGTARARLGAEEGVLDQLTDILSRAKELAISQAGANANTNTRLTAKAEIDELIQSAVQLGNTRFGNSFLFGGNYADVAPFATDGSASTTQPPSGSMTIDVGANVNVVASDGGQEIFIDAGVFGALQQLSDALGDNKPDDIRSSIASLDTAFDNTQTRLGEVGARVNHLDVAASNVETLQVNLQVYRSDLADADLEESMTKLLARQTAFQAALATTARMLSTTLTDYLR